MKQTFQQLQAEVNKGAEKTLALAIMQQEDELIKASHTVAKTMMGIPNDNPYNLRQQFTFVSAVDRTLETMYAFYQASFGKEFTRTDWEEKPAKTVTLKELITQLGETQIKVE